jgi:hypothetical protein
MLNNRGAVRMIEALLAVGVIFAALTFAYVFPVYPSFSAQKDLAKTGSQTLLVLDSNGDLGNLIDEGNWSALREALDMAVPAGVSFNLTVYDAAGAPLNPQLIQNSNIYGNEMVSVRYMCASQNLNVNFYTLQLQLAQVK